MKRSMRVLPLLALLALAACDDPFGPGRTLRDYVALDTGVEHACAVTAEGEAFCWGAGERGQLGYGWPAEDRDMPTLVDTPELFEQITTGDGHTCALTPEGRAWCWGWNVYMQRGTDEAWDVNPTEVQTELHFTSIDAGWQHTCAIAEDSTVHCWGAGTHGQLGNGTTVRSAGVTPVVGGLQATQVSAGARHTCAVRTDGVLVCWGDNSNGQLGIGSDAVFVSEPTPVNSSLRFTQVSAGATHTCAVAQDGFPYCWGSNAFGEAGDGLVYLETDIGYRSPNRVNIGIGVHYIRAGLHTTCARATDNIGYCGGRGAELQLGNGDPRPTGWPQGIYVQPGRQNTSDRFRFVDIRPSMGTFTCGLVENNVFCWGTGQRGELGAGSNTMSSMPQRIRG